MNKKIAICCLCALIASLVTPSGIFAASFDCEKAASKIEKLICSDDELSQLDESLSEAYLQALERANIKQQIIESQREWLKYERNLCQTVECMKKAYVTRINELHLTSDTGYVIHRDVKRYVSPPKAPEKESKQEQSPAPYHCIKICLQDSRRAREACSENKEEYHSCMKKAYEQQNACRKKCQDEEKAAVSGKKLENDGIKAFNSNETSAGTDSSVSFTVKFDIIDKRDPAEREGYPYPKSWFSYVMHGDRSLDVDRMSIFKTKLIEYFGSKLEGKQIILTQFYVMENTVRPAFVKTPSGEQVPNKGPFLPTLISEITIIIDGNYFHGSAMLPLRQGSKATKSALTLATTMTVDDLFKDIGRRGLNPFSSIPVR